MTRTRVVGAGLAGLMVLSVLVPAAASAGGQEMRFRHYRGTTSQGEQMKVTTYTVGTTTRLHSVNFGLVTADCEDGTQLKWGMGIEWGRGLQMPPERLDFDDVWSSEAIHVHGRLGVHGGSGTFSDAWPVLTADEQGAQLCTTGELTWELRRTAAEQASLPAADVQTLITSGADGTTTRTIVTSGADGTTRTVITSGADGTMGSVVTSGPKTAAGTSHLRNYRGRTSQAHPMAVTTAKVDSTIELRGLDIAWTLGCEDGTELGPWATYMTLGPGWTLPPARLDFDDVWYEEATRIHGRLGTHVGSGTFSDAAAVLTADEQAMFCTTGDLTWRAWRIDAGARIIVP